MRKKGKNNGHIIIFSVVLPFGIRQNLISKAIKGVKGRIEFHTILVIAPA
jgi:hypothetical protein